MTIPAKRTFCGAICAVALTLGLAAAASAAPIVPASPAKSAVDQVAPSGLPIEQVRSRGGRHGGGRPGRGHWNHGGWNGHHHGGYRPRYYGPRYYGPGPYYGGTGLYFGWGIPSYRYDPYYLPAPVYRRPIYRARRIGNAHVRWCYQRYRSYRAYDNTYQPYNGPRRQCLSPYG